MWKRFRSNIGAMVGVVLLVAVIFIAIFAPLIFANTPWQISRGTVVNVFTEWFRVPASWPPPPPREP